MKFNLRQKLKMRCVKDSKKGEFMDVDFSKT